MRRWFVVLLIVLLPWRAWAGDAMVLSVALTTDHAVAGVPAAAVVPHCADHAMPEATSPGEPTAHAACDICKGPLLAVATPAGTGSETLSASRLTSGPVRFASALPRPGHKPPIF